MANDETTASKMPCTGYRLSRFGVPADRYCYWASPQTGPEACRRCGMPARYELWEVEEADKTAFRRIPKHTHLGWKCWACSVWDQRVEPVLSSKTAFSAVPIGVNIRCLSEPPESSWKSAAEAEARRLKMMAEPVRFFLEEVRPEKRLELRREGPSPLDAADAVRDSIRKWNFLAQHAESFPHDGGSGTCGCCLYAGIDCKKCPIGRKPERTHCLETPYWKYSNLWYEGVQMNHFSPERAGWLQTAAEDEVCFLKGVLAELAASVPCQHVDIRTRLTALNLGTVLTTISSAPDIPQDWVDHERCFQCGARFTFMVERHPKGTV